MSKRSRLRSLALESLEQRTLMATAPVSVVTNQAAVSLGASTVDDSSPFVAVDPINPLKLATEFTRRDISSGTAVIETMLSTSNDGGKTWQDVGLPGNLSDPTSSTGAPYPVAVGAGVAFDRNENLYVGVLQYNGSVNAPGNSGAVAEQIYSFQTQDAILSGLYNIVYQWDQAQSPGDPAVANALLTIDNNLPTYTDPNTGAVQTDPNVGDVYVAITTITPNPNNLPDFNPNAIFLFASDDGGITFPTGVFVDNGNFGPQRDTAPRIAISQGKAGQDDGGLVTVIWDDFGSGADASPPVDLITADPVDVAPETAGQDNGPTLTPTEITFVAIPTVRGALDAPYALKSPASPTGIGPGAEIAVDNTLGSFSPHQGRIYVTYTDRTVATNNPADNTDIYLVFSDDDGDSWSTPTMVNDDNAVIDGHSSSATIPDLEDGTAAFVDGRPQFQPSIAVDPSSGTVALSWLDVRDSAADSTYATYVTSSIDGGDTFSPQTYANTPNQVLDAITGKQVIIGPYSDNESSSNTSAETSISFGEHQALVIADGVIHPIWASTTMDSFDNAHLTIETAQASYPNGPRIISGTMGTIAAQTVRTSDTALSNTGTFTFNNTFSSADHTPQVNGFTVTFDEPVDVSTFLPSAVEVVFRDTTTSLSTPGTPIAVASIEPVDSFYGGAEATTFFVRFATPQSNVGTYSYAVGPTIMDRLRVVPKITVVPDGAAVTYAATAPQVPMPIPDASILSGPGSAISTITISTPPPTEVVDHITVNLTIDHTFDSNLTVVLIAPSGDSFVLIDGDGGSGKNFINTTFSDTAIQSINGGNAPFTGTFTPVQPLSNFIGEPLDGVWSLQVIDNVPKNSGTIIAWSMTITPGVMTLSDVARGHQMDQNANGVAGESTDVFSNPTPLGGTPFIAPYDTATLPIVVPGPHVVSSFVPGATASADNLVVNNTVGFMDVTFDRDINPLTFTGAQVIGMSGPNGVIAGPFTVAPETNAAFMQPDENGTTRVRTFRVSFPAQAISGTYTITLSPTIRSTRGNALDTNENAGVDLLFDKSTPGDTTANITYPATALPLTIPAGGTITSTITVNDFYLIQNFILTLNIAYPNDPDLEATLTGPTGAAIQLFKNVGAVGPVSSRENFSNTVFDDAAATPIQNGSPPFFGRFNPQEPFSSLLTGLYQVHGTYTLTIKNDGTSAGSLNAWSMTIADIANPDTGLGEPIADQATTSFRIFTMDPTNALASNTWTAVGPAAVNTANTSVGRVSTVALDPSDPSGNTAYVAGASGGIWKTNDFLTTNPQGPTYIPLTDFGPTDSLTVGTIAVFPRNNDPRQSIIVAGTGDPDVLNSDGFHGVSTDGPGVGFLVSYNGGASWTLDDSSSNVDSSGNELPDTKRDHVFVGSTIFKVIADPHLSPTGNVILYAAVSGGSAPGIYRSLDGARTWALLRAGDATDVVFDANSGTINAISNPTGNLRTLYGAFTGGSSPGIYITPNQGQTWNEMVGGVGDPLIHETFTLKPVPVGSSTLSTGTGRIVLAKPTLTNDALLNTEYETWLYAAIVDSSGNFQGLYMTKDDGQNWTKLQLPDKSFDTLNGFPDEVVPTNDNTVPNYNLTQGQGTFDLSLAVDPNNPNIVYVGGNADAQPTTLIRVDATRVADPYSLTVDPTRLGAQRLESTTDPVTIRDPKNLDFNPFLAVADPIFEPAINLVRNPTAPFLNNSTFFVSDAGSFTNSGSGVYWTPFTDFLNYSANDTPQSAFDVDSLLTLSDPATGKTRLIVGLNQGVYTAVDDGTGSLIESVGTDSVVTGTRDGNLQIAQLYNGAAQPGSLAAAVAGALLYGTSQDNGVVSSDPNILADGNINWTAVTGTSTFPISLQNGTSTDIAADPTGSGTSYVTEWPIEVVGGTTTDFFQVNPTGQGYTSRTFGLLQTSGNDPQWPGAPATNFAVNPIDNQEIIIGSEAGRLFGTENQGKIWYVLADPSTFDGTPIPALAYGAPDPNGPGAPGALDNYLIVGTLGGNIYVTFTGGGGSGNSNAWTSLDNGLVDNASIERIVTDPTRGTHDAYAISTDNVYYNADTSAANSAWVPITGNLFSLTHTPFGDTNLVEDELHSLDGLTADWRYVVPDNPANPGGPTHPLLYVAGDGGVYRSTDNGTTWSLFPAGATIVSAGQSGSLSATVTTTAGGDLPDVNVTDLDMVLGNVDPTTGHADVSTGPNLLLATTYGRGSFGIRLAPVVFNDGTNNVSFSVNTTGQLIFSGLSEQTAFGNQVAITVEDVTNPNSPIFLGGYSPGDMSNPADGGSFFNTANETNSFGQFNVNGTYPTPPANNPYLYDGTRTVEIFATDGSGTKGNVVLFQYTNNPPTPNAPVLLSAHLVTGGVDVTKVTAPNFMVTLPGNSSIPVSVSLIRIDAQGNTTTVATATITGSGTIQDPGPVAVGTYKYEIKYQVTVGTTVVTSPASAATTVQIISSQSGSASLTAMLNPADDSSHGQDVTNVTRPHIIGNGIPNPNADPNLKLSLLLSAEPAGATFPLNTPLTGSTIADPSTGQYSIQFPTALQPDGIYTVYVQATDGIVGDFINSPTVTFTIKTSGPKLIPTLAILPADVVPGYPQTASAGKTDVRRPHLYGRTDPGSIVNIYQVLPGGGLVLQATTTSQSAAANGNPAGYFLAQLPFNLSDGTIALEAFATDFAGNTTAAGPVFNLTVTTVKGDYNGDGKADIGIYRPSTATWYVALSGTTSTAITPYGYAGVDVPIPGDYDGDGRTDIAVFRPTTDTWYLDRSQLGQTSIQFGYVGHDIPVPAGYDASGFTDVAVYRPSTAQWFILHNSVGSGGSSTLQVSFGEPNVDKPVPADYEGVNSDQIAVYRPTTGQWFVRNSTTGVTDSTVVVLGGAPGDIPVPADYDGIGRAEEAIYRPSTGQYFIYNPLTQQVRTVAIGNPNTDVPVPEDYTGSGRIDVAVYRTTTGQWFYIDPTNGNTLTTTFGAKLTDIPLPGPLPFSLPTGRTGSGGLVTSGLTVGAGGGGSSGGLTSAATGLGSSSGTTIGFNTVVAGTPPSGSTSTGKASTRPNSGPVATPSPIKLVTDSLNSSKSDSTKSPIDLALEGLGRTYQGRFFG